MLPEKLKLQILKTTAADFGNQENTKLEIFYEQPSTSATDEHHRCQPSSDSQEQPLSRSWWLSSSNFDFGFQEDDFFAKYASLLFDFKVLIKFSKSSKLPKNGKKMKDEKMAHQDGFGSCPWAKTHWRTTSDVWSTSSDSLLLHRLQFRTVRYDLQDDGKISIKKGVSKWRQKSKISPASKTSLSTHELDQQAIEHLCRPQHWLSLILPASIELLSILSWFWWFWDLGIISIISIKFHRNSCRCEFGI